MPIYQYLIYRCWARGWSNPHIPISAHLHVGTDLFEGAALAAAARPAAASGRGVVIRVLAVADTERADAVHHLRPHGGAAAAAHARPGAGGPPLCIKARKQLPPGTDGAEALSLAHGLMGWMWKAERHVSLNR